MIEPSSLMTVQLPSPAPQKGPQAGHGEITLFQSQGLLVTSERLVAAGRTWQLAEVEHVEAIRRGPRVFPLLVALALGVVVGLPVLLAAMAARGSQGKGIYEVALVLAGMAIFSSIAGLLLIGDTYWLVLRTRHSERRVFRSRQHQTVSSLAAVVTEAVESARRRHVRTPCAG
jgi:hypothetical protein